MTVAEVQERVLAIGRIAGDDEAAHSYEDKLYEDVLRAIVDGHETPALLAKAALETKSIDSKRWCA